MNGKLLRALLLFSFVFLFGSCSLHSNQSYETMAQNNDYAKIAQISATQYYKTYEAYDLYYLAFAQWMNVQSLDALRTCDLYLGLYNEQESTYKANHVLRLQAALKQKEYTKAIESGTYLEDIDALEPDLASLYYQALSNLGRKGEANRIFLKYLSKTLDPYSYVTLLYEGQAGEAELKAAVARLSLDETLRFLSGAVTTSLDVIRANMLVQIASPLESLALDTDQEKKLFGILAILYTTLDSRILARKYLTLSQK